MGRPLHLIPLLALGAALNGCRDAVPPLAPTISRPRFSQVSGPLEGKITFNSNRNGNVDVFVMNPDGSGVTQVTTNPLDELLPLFSPDGTQIVFGRCSSICDIVVINADGSGERTILNDGFPGAWSPDGNRIVLGRNDGLYVINADGSGLVRVLDPDFVTDWSPDGRQLMIVSRRDGDLELYPTNLDGSGVTQLTHNTCDDNAGNGWSPDGTRIAFYNNCDGDNEIFVMNADGSGVTQLTQNEFDDGGAAWSPDGTQLAFQSSRAGDTQIFVMNADGSNVTQLTSGPPGVTNFAPHWIRQLALSNDAFADATVISTLPFSDRVNISAASMEGGEPPSSCSGSSSSQRTVWYSFTPAVNTVVTASVNASFSTVVGVYTGGLGGLAEITCRSPFVVRDATFLAQAGTTYHIQVDGMFAQTGVLEVRLEAVPPPPNDLFGNATGIGALPFSDTVDLTAATNEGGEPSPSCAAPFGGVSSSAWYRFTPTVTGSISANAFSGGFSNAVAAYSGTSVTSLTEVACGVFSNRATFRAVANTTYFFQVGGLFGQRGPLEFRLDVTPLPVANFFFFPFDASVFDVVQFVDQSFDPGGVGFAPQTWTFGDGMTGSTGNPTHRYAADGDYTVRLTATTLDGRSAVASQTVHVRTHDVAITRFSVPQTARSGQTKRLEVSINSKRYAETVEVQLFKSVPGGFQQFGSLTQSVPMNPKNGTTDFAFSYTFTADDATIGKVTFRAVAVISGARDALSADNEAIGPPTRVSR